MKIIYQCSSSDFADRFYHYFIIPFMLIGGTLEIVHMEPRIIWAPVGMLTIVVAIFLIWLDRNYDLS